MVSGFMFLVSGVHPLCPSKLGGRAKRRGYDINGKGKTEKGKGKTENSSLIAHLSPFIVFLHTPSPLRGTPPVSGGESGWSTDNRVQRTTLTCRDTACRVRQGYPHCDVGTSEAEGVCYKLKGERWKRELPFHLSPYLLSVLCTLLSVLCTLYSVLCYLPSVLCTPYSVLSSPYSKTKCSAVGVVLLRCKRRPIPGAVHSCRDWAPCSCARPLHPLFQGLRR